MLRWIERALLALGLVCLGYVGYVTLEARHFQRASGCDGCDGRDRCDRCRWATSLIGIMEIPRLNVSSPVMSGDGEKTLDVAVGHLPDTPKPWEGGNSAFAAHRDGLFRPLKDIRVGDDVRVRSVHGEFVYRVRHTRIVEPDDLSVLAPTESDTLTLITCYPFTFIGHAPKRFIVQALRTKSTLRN